jgi:hypothetical protein
MGKVEVARLTSSAACRALKGGEEGRRSRSRRLVSLFHGFAFWRQRPVFGSDHGAADSLACRSRSAFAPTWLRYLKSQARNVLQAPTVSPPNLHKPSLPKRIASTRAAIPPAKEEKNSSVYASLSPQPERPFPTTGEDCLEVSDGARYRT